MRGSDIIRAIDRRQDEEFCFVRVWRKENDFLDVDLISRFREQVGGRDEFGGMDLLTMDDLWREIKRIGGARVILSRSAKGDSITWTHTGRSGTHTNVCAYTPETLMQIYDVETRGTPVDS